MTTLVEYMIVASAENHPSMLDKLMYNSWESRMFLYIKGKKNGRIMLESIKNRPLVYVTIEENGQIRKKKYANLTEQEQLQDDCDVQATNIVLQGLRLDVYALGQSFVGTGTKGNATSLRGNNVVGLARIVKCYNCQGEGHMARQFTKSKRPRNSAWFQEKMLLTNDLDAYDSDCDDISSAQTVLMANLLSYGSNVLSELNKLAEDVGKRFVPQKELSAEQTFWLQFSNPFSKQPDVQTTLVRNKAPSELLKVSMVKTSFQKLKNHLASFDKVVKVRTTPDAITEGSWGFEHTIAVFKQEAIPFIKTLWDLFKDFDNGLHSEINEVKTFFNLMEAVVEHCSVDKKYFDIQKKEIFLDNDRLLEHIICQDVMNIVMHADSVPVNVLPANNKCLVHDNHEIERLEQENDHLFEPLLSQDIVHICVNSLASCNDCCEMQHGFVHEYNENLMLKVELANAEHMVEKKFFYEVVLRCSRLENPTCPSLSKPNEKLVAVTPLNKNKKVRWKPTGQTFTIVRNTCPLTRITSSKVKPLNELVTTPNPKIQIYRRKTKVAKSVDLSSEPSILGSSPSNISEPNKHWGSTMSKSPSSSLVNFRKPDLSYLYIFDALCYPTNDSEDLGKLKPKADIAIFISYAPTKKAYRIYKRTHLVIETIHVDFDEQIAMASEQFNLEPETQLLTPKTLSSGLLPNPPSPTPVVSPVPVAAALRLADPTVIPSGVEEHSYDIEVAHLDNNPFFSILIPEPNSEESSSRDVIPTNLHSVIDHLNILVYVSLPDGFVDQDNLNHVYKLKKSLYGLMQAPQAWYDLLSWFLLSQKFSKSVVDPTFFTQKEGKDILLDSCIVLTAFADVDHAGCQDTRRSTSGSMQLLGDRLVSWSSKKQKKTSISSTEAESFLYLDDIFTKALRRERLEFLINKLRMGSMSPETLKGLVEVDED
ncbi:integrase, catalytic region, zinc finger, CCHC-type containing protein [Tanacetum coccineum]